MKAPGRRSLAMEGSDSYRRGLVVENELAEDEGARARRKAQARSRRRPRPSPELEKTRRAGDLRWSIRRGKTGVSSAAARRSLCSHLRSERAVGGGLMAAISCGGGGSPWLGRSGQRGRRPRAPTDPRRRGGASRLGFRLGKVRARRRRAWRRTAGVGEDGRGRAAGPPCPRAARALAGDAKEARQRWWGEAGALDRVG